MKMKSANYKNLIITKWSNHVVTILNKDTGRTSLNVIRQHTSGDPEKAYIIKNGKRIYLYQFDAEPCGGNFIFHFLHD